MVYLLCLVKISWFFNKDIVKRCGVLSCFNLKVNVVEDLIDFVKIFFFLVFYLFWK